MFAFFKPGSLEERFVPGLLEALEDKDDRVRMGLSQVTHLEKIGPIVRCLRDKAKHVRMNDVTRTGRKPGADAV